MGVDSEYYKYPLDTLPDLGFSLCDHHCIPRESWWKHARKLTTDEIDLLQSGYMWLQTSEDHLLFPFPPPPVKASYSELWFMLRMLYSDLTNARTNFKFSVRQEHKVRYELTNQAYTYEALIDSSTIICFLCDVVCRCAEFERDMQKMKEQYGHEMRNMYNGEKMND
jgi:hypothetical protein